MCYQDAPPFGSASVLEFTILFFIIVGIQIVSGDEKLLHVSIPLNMTHQPQNENLDHHLHWVEDPEIIYDILRNPKLYRKNIPPGQVHNITTDVKLGFYIESMSSLKSSSMDFDVDMYLASLWYDSRLRHDKAHPVLINDQRISSMIWQPDIYFVNSKHAALQSVTSLNYMMLVFPNGQVFKSVRVSATLACVMDFARFPMDTQTCPIMIQSYAFVESVVNVTWFVDKQKGFPVSYNPNIRLNDMEIVSRSYGACGYWYEMLTGKGYWSCLKGEIKLKRQIFYHVLQTYTPTAMLACISWLSFWLDPRASPARVGLTITTLLTLTTMGGGAKFGLPQVSYVKAIDIWFSLCTGYVFSVLLEYALVSFFICRRIKNCKKHSSERSELLLWREKEDIPPELQQLVNMKFLATRTKQCPVCALEDENRALRVDKASRTLFPLSFAGCALFYWTYYLWN